MVRSLLLPVLACLGTSLGAASAQYMCFDDVNGDGRVDGVLESASCPDARHCPLDEIACAPGNPGSPAYLCPRAGETSNGCTPFGGSCLYRDDSDPSGRGLVAEACLEDPDAAPPTGPTCPIGPHACRADGAGGHVCSPSACTDMSAPGALTGRDRPREALRDDGARDTDGECQAILLIFNGYAMDCRPSGARTLFRNCCQDRGKVITDSQGAALGLGGTAVGVTATFVGMRAAYAAYQSGATAAGAASAGGNAMLAALDPTTLAIAAAVTLMIDLLALGCDQQDMETGILGGSGMCHRIGTYCATDSPFGCLQTKRAHCCFNSMLGRIIHEQGRLQIARFAALPNAGWGDVEAPYCAGFTPAEFQALDFGAMDLSEYYAELRTRTAAEMNVLMQEKVDDYVATNGL